MVVFKAGFGPIFPGAMIPGRQVKSQGLGCSNRAALEPGPGGGGSKVGSDSGGGRLVAKPAFSQCLLSLLYSLYPASGCTLPLYLLKRAIVGKYPL